MTTTQIDSVRLLIQIIVRETLRQKRLGCEASQIEENVMNEYLKSQEEQK